MPERINPGWSSFAGKTYAPGVITSGALLFTSGLNALDESGALIGEGDVVAQASEIYRKLGALIRAVGASPGDVVKTTDFIITREGYRRTADVRRAFFGDHRPASTGVVVQELLGRGVLIEIEAVVHVPERE